MSSSLDHLRAEYDDLVIRRRRTSLVGLFALLLVVYPFSSAVKRLSSDQISDVSSRIKELNCLTADHPGERKLSFVFSAWTRECDSNSFQGSSLSEAERSARVTLLRSEIEGLASDWLRIEYNLLGSTLDIDSRQAVPLIPLILWYLAVYLRVTHLKRRCLQQVGHSLILSDGDSSTVDRIRFAEGKTSAYERHPQDIEHAAYSVTLVASLLYLIISTVPLWTPIVKSPDFEPASPLVLGLAFLYYGIAYCVMVRRSLDVQFLGACSNTRSDKAIAWIGRGRRKLGALISSFPRSGWTSGCLAVLVTLFLTMEQSCDTPYRGIDVLRRKDEAGWPLANMAPIFGGAYEWVNNSAGLLAYTLAIAIGFLGVILVAIQLFRSRRLSEFFGSTLLSGMLGILTAFVWAQFATYSLLIILVSWLFHEESWYAVVVFYAVYSPVFILLILRPVLLRAKHWRKIRVGHTDSPWPQFRDRYITGVIPLGAISAFCLVDVSVLGPFLFLVGVAVMSVALQKDLGSRSGAIATASRRT